MESKFSRTEMLVGNEGMEKLKEAKVAVLALEALVPLSVKGLQEAEWAILFWWTSTLWMKATSTGS